MVDWQGKELFQILEFQCNDPQPRDSLGKFLAENMIDRTHAQNYKNMEIWRKIFQNQMMWDLGLPEHSMGNQKDIKAKIEVKPENDRRQFEVSQDAGV